MASGAGDVVGVWLLLLVMCGVAGAAGLIGARFLVLVMRLMRVGDAVDAGWCVMLPGLLV